MQAQWVAQAFGVRDPQLKERFVPSSEAVRAPRPWAGACRCCRSCWRALLGQWRPAAGAAGGPPGRDPVLAPVEAQRRGRRGLAPRSDGPDRRGPAGRRPPGPAPGARAVGGDNPAP
jgi:hypothetical protein